MNGIESGSHLSDTEVLHYIDGDASPQDSRRWRDHVQACPRCAGAARSLDADSRLVTEWLARARFEDDSFENPADRHVPGLRLTPWLRAAAILALLAAPVAAIPSLRGWVVERVVDADPTGSESAMSTAPEEPTVLRFVPAAGEFVVSFTAGSQGAITIDRSDDERAVLTAIGGEPETLVSATALQISNRDPARYHLALPATITGLWVRIGDRAVAVSQTSIDRGTVVELEGR